MGNAFAGVSVSAISCRSFLPERTFAARRTGAMGHWQTTLTAANRVHWRSRRCREVLPGRKDLGCATNSSLQKKCFLASSCSGESVHEPFESDNIRIATGLFSSLLRLYHIAEPANCFDKKIGGKNMLRSIVAVFMFLSPIFLSECVLAVSNHNNSWGTKINRIRNLKNDPICDLSRSPGRTYFIAYVLPARGRNGEPESTPNWSSLTKD